MRGAPAENWRPAMMATGRPDFARTYGYSRLPTDLTLPFTHGNAVIATFDDVDTARAWRAIPDMP